MRARTMSSLPPPSSPISDLTTLTATTATPTATLTWAPLGPSNQSAAQTEPDRTSGGASSLVLAV